jgi:hypothetical protein
MADGLPINLNFTGGGGYGQESSSSNSSTAQYLEQWLKSLAEGSTGTRDALLGVFEDVLKTGGSQATIPIISKAVEASMQATSDASRQTAESLAASGLAGTPFGVGEMARTYQQGRQATSQIPAQFSQQILNLIPDFILGLNQNIAQAGQAAVPGTLEQDSTGTSLGAGTGMGLSIPAGSLLKGILSGGSGAGTAAATGMGTIGAGTMASTVGGSTGLSTGGVMGAQVGGSATGAGAGTALSSLGTVAPWAIAALYAAHIIGMRGQNGPPNHDPYTILLASEGITENPYDASSLQFDESGRYLTDAQGITTDLQDINAMTAMKFQLAQTLANATGMSNLGSIESYAGMTAEEILNAFGIKDATQLKNLLYPGNTFNQATDPSGGGLS